MRKWRNEPLRFPHRVAKARRAGENFVGSNYTCDAVSAARQDAGIGPDRYNNPVSDFLFKLGLPRDAEERFELFDQFASGSERQGVRYMWLLLAMHVADDEGIEIEVQS